MLKRLTNKLRKALFNTSHLDDLLNKGFQQEINHFRKDIRVELAKREYEKLFLTCRGNGITDSHYDGDQIIVSLTTYGPRIHDVYLVIESIMQQTLKPNKILLWLAENEFTRDQIPESLKILEKRGLEIKFCEDLKSYKKLIPSLKIYPDAIIVTIDDDVLYPIDLLDRLYKQHLSHPHDIICTHAHIIEFSSDGIPVPYVQWVDPPTDRSRESKSFLPIGIGGVLYPPHCLHPDVFDQRVFMEIAPTADDLWFKFMALRNGVSCRTTPIYEMFDSWITPINRSISESLYDVNVTANDKQFAKLLSNFGYDMYTFDVCETTSERIIPELYAESVEQWVLFLKHKYAYELACSKIKKGDRLLEIGCGDGYGANMLSSFCASITAVDVDRTSIDYAKRKYAKDSISFEYYDGKTINEPDHSFDFIVSFQVIEHVADVKLYLENIKRLLKPDGVFIITTPSRTYRLTPDQKPWNEFHLREYDFHSLKGEMEAVFPKICNYYSISAKEEVLAIEKERCRQNRLDYDNKEFHYIFKRANFESYYSTKDFFLDQTDIDSGLDLLVSNIVLNEA